MDQYYIIVLFFKLGNCKTSSCMYNVYNLSKTSSGRVGLNVGMCIGDEMKLEELCSDSLTCVCKLQRTWKGAKVISFYCLAFSHFHFYYTTTKCVTAAAAIRFQYLHSFLRRRDEAFTSCLHSEKASRNFPYFFIVAWQRSEHAKWLFPCTVVAYFL